MSSLVDFDDLTLLDANDLRALVRQVRPEILQAALAGLSPAGRVHLLAALPPALAQQLHAEVEALGEIHPAVSHLAQRAVVDTLCQLGRCGLIAFDDPYDMVPDSLVA